MRKLPVILDELLKQRSTPFSECLWPNLGIAVCQAQRQVGQADTRRTAQASPWVTEKERAVLVAGSPRNCRDVDLIVVVFARVGVEKAPLDGVVRPNLGQTV